MRALSPRHHLRVKVGLVRGMLRFSAAGLRSLRIRAGSTHPNTPQHTPTQSPSSRAACAVRVGAFVARSGRGLESWRRTMVAVPGRRRRFR
jgi:hypothetical protein